MNCWWSRTTRSVDIARAGTQWEEGRPSGAVVASPGAAVPPQPLSPKHTPTDGSAVSCRHAVFRRGRRARASRIRRAATAILTAANAAKSVTGAGCGGSGLGGLPLQPPVTSLTRPAHLDQFGTLALRAARWTAGLECAVSMGLRLGHSGGPHR